jgi:mono/diheme cytochrome c family protein
MTGAIELVIVVVLAVCAAWFSVRAWRSDRTAAWLAPGLAVVAVVLGIASVLGLIGVFRLYAPRASPAANVAVQLTPDQLIVATRRASGCRGCHSSGTSPALDGGTANLLAGTPGLGVLVAPNLTPAGPLKDWTDGEIVRAIREGIDRDGRPLLIMPSESFHALSDTDVSMLVAYLRSQPATSHATPARDLNLLGLALVGGGLLPTAEQPHITAAQAAPFAGNTAEYGRYLVDITGCRTCHGPNLEGRAASGFGPPAGPNLRMLIPQWLDGDFVRFFRTGIDPSGRAVDPAMMPWLDIGNAYTDDELRAMFSYLRALP